ncbi:MAG: hypothetical protein PF503_18140 [Desulfobacula sp.]|nr:hypothetical protein [Desulfobacula sp.]
MRHCSPRSPVKLANALGKALLDLGMAFKTAMSAARLNMKITGEIRFIFVC